jgi:saccharopine dehydrogenase-like NADP-dependent oxidoreductase
VDARDFDQLSRLMKEVDIVVNAAHYSLNLELIDTCLKNGYNYIGLTGGEEFYIQISQRSI